MGVGEGEREKKKGKCETLNKISSRKVATAVDRKQQTPRFQNQNERLAQTRF